MARTWIVTGASRGIGLAIARAALAAGDRVALVARGTPPADVLGSDGALHIAEDVAADGAADRIVAATCATYGDGVDVLVNNAARHVGGRIEGLTDEDFESVVATNLVAPFRLIRAVVARMPSGGAVVNIGSVVGRRGFTGDSPYGSAKAGLMGLTQVLAVELAARGITVNCVIPGVTDTDMIAALDERARRRLLERIPIRRACTPEEIAEVALWVSASRAMTGALVPVDGGLMAALGSSK